MYLPSNIDSGRNSNGTPLKYTVRARDEIRHTLMQKGLPLRYGSSPLLNSINASQLTINDNASINSVETEDQQQPKKMKKLFGLGLKKYVSLESRSDSDSLFSKQPTILTTATSTYGLEIPAVSLEEALPSDFKDMYSADTLQDTLPNGRPVFTQRDVLDWQINDIRSLLIVDELKKQWMGQIPQIIPQNGVNFKIQLIPLNATDEDIVRTLVGSDIYKETNFHLNFKIKTATYIVKTVRQKHLTMLKQYYQLQSDIYDQQLINTPLLKYEMRNIIENYLLNLGVENQCRSNFKKNCLILKKQKLQLYNLNEDFDKDKNLLKTALINNSNLYLNLPNIDKSSIKLSRDEKLKIWNQVQTEVYQKLNLDWQPDEIN